MLLSRLCIVYGWPSHSSKEGPSRADAKIKDDTFRTFKNHDEFWSRVEESQLIRILNALERWHHHDYCIYSNQEMSDSTKPAYVQGTYMCASKLFHLHISYVEAFPLFKGMNVMLGIFLYIMPELDAFYCFRTFVSTRCPQYITPTLKGVHLACRLVAKLLMALDKELAAHLIKLVDPKIFAFAPCMSFMASLKPLSEVVKLWDFILALGCHFVVIFYVTHLILMRDLLLSEGSSYR